MLHILGKRFVTVGNSAFTEFATPLYFAEVSSGGHHMQILFHLGAHCTDDGLLIRSILRNRARLSLEGIIVPGPGRYRKLIREAVQSLDCAVPTAEAQEAMLDAITDADDAERLILSNENFLCVPAWIFSNGMFYGMATERALGLSNLFHGSQIEFHLGLRNPATFLPAAFGRVDDLSFEDFLRGADPRALRWSQLVTRIREANPDAGMTIWCNEDTPLIWSEVMREMAGVDAMMRLTGGFDLLAEIMTREGMKRFRAYLKAHPPQTETQKRRIIVAFLDKFAIDEKIEEELDVPGWTDDLVEDLTRIYEEDVYEIQRMPGVTFIEP